MKHNNPIQQAQIQVDKSLYVSSIYCRPQRFASFSYQILEVLALEPERVLEVGPGNGVVTYLLRKAGIHVETLDFDPNLNTDHVASVLDLPLSSDSFDVVLCCQVLEHLPWEQFTTAMTELTRVAKKCVVLSLPHHSKSFHISWKLPKLKSRIVNFDFESRERMKFDGEHYWEIGRGFNSSMIIDAIEKTHWKVQRHFRAPENKYHHFFIVTP